MNTIKVTREDVERDYPAIYNEFVESLRTSNSLSRKMDLEKAKWFYTWGSFVKKAKTNADKILKDLKTNDKFGMMFDERLELELSKIRINVTMEAGKFLRGDRARKMLDIPEPIKDLVTETTKIQMILEQRQHNNQNVVNSIPEINNDIIPREQLATLLGEEGIEAVEEVEELNVDTILEKITKTGLDSLTDKEREFLDNQE